MEGFGRRERRRSSSWDSSEKSGISAGIHRSFGEKSDRAAVDRVVRKGREERRKECSTTKLGSSSNSRSTSIAREDDLLALNLGKHTSDLLTGTVMKKLIADGMSRDIEPRRRPSVIARLMGLDGFPAPHQDANKQHKKTSDSNHSLTTASTACHRYGKNQSNRKTSREQAQFKDVYEVAGSSRVLGEGGHSHVSSTRKKSQDEMDFARKEFVDAKYFPSYGRLSDTKEFADALEMLGCSEDLLLKYVNQPDSIIAKHLQYLHDSCDYRWEHDGGMGSGSMKHNINSIGCQSDLEASRKIDISFSRKHQGSVLSRFRYNHDNHSEKMSHLGAERKEDPSTTPDTIVVLKPNLEKPQNSGRRGSSSNLLPDFEVCKERHIRRGDVELWGKKLIADGLDMSGIASQESRQLAKEVTRRMKQKLDRGSFIASQNGYKGYSADESSYDLSGYDSSYESEGTDVLSRMSLHRSSCREASGSRYTEACVNMEAKKRLSERWKMTRRSHESQLVDRGSTLGEMLAIPELDARASNMEAASALDESSRFCRRYGAAGPMIPLAISSKDGWKDQSSGIISSSRSLPSSSDYFGSREFSCRHEALVAEKFLVPKEHSRSRNKETRRSASTRDRKKRSGQVHHQERGVGHVPGVQSGVNERESSLRDDDSPDVKAVISETPARLIHASLITDDVVDLDPGCFPGLVTSPDQHDADLEFPGHMQVEDESLGTDLQEYTTKETSEMNEVEATASSRCPASEPELGGTVKEADQPSPNSILEACFEDDLSSGSDCFERVNADLRGLRMQLQLLKQENQAYDEGPLAISTIVDADEFSSVHSVTGRFLDDEGSWVSSYFLDMLFHSGFDNIDHETLGPTLDSIGCVVAPWVFEKLEKKYCSRAVACSRVERRLLFDRISYGMTEIVNQVRDSHPWVSHGKGSSGLQWDKEGLKLQLCGLLKSQEVVEIKTPLNDATVSDRDWMDLGDEINVLGVEIEEQLIDELLGDFSWLQRDLPAPWHAVSGM